MKGNYILQRFKKIGYMTNNFVDEKISFPRKLIIWGDLLISIIVLGAGITDYFQYKFYKKKMIEKRNFIVHRKRMKIVNKSNNKEDMKIFNDKKEFNRIFDDFISRDWLDLEEDSFEAFVEFANKHKKFIVKPKDGSHGKGIYFVDTNELKDLRYSFEKIAKEKAIIEEIIVQNKEVAEFNPASVNTLRVVTFVDHENTPHVMTANLRVGRGQRIADNFHHEGIASLIDIDTGIVVTRGIDGKSQRYVVHPISGKKIVGFEIPLWEEVKDLAKRAALVVPTVRYVGWDVALGEEGKIYIVEGNCAADPDISQLPDQEGKWNLYKPYLDKL